MTMKKLLLIYNPAAGKAHFSSHLNEIVDYYTKQHYVVTVYPTQESEDGKRFVKLYGNQYDLIVCAGGDGTLNEIVSGMLDAQILKPLGYIPCGSTNDFAKSIGIPSTLKEAVIVTNSDNLSFVDVGRFNDKHFVYVAGFGLFTNVSYATPQEMKNSLGHLAYILEGIKALSDIQLHNITLEYEQGVITGEFIIGLIVNSYSVGGFKNPFYGMTQLDDGLFEVILVRMPKSLIELQAVITDLINGNIGSEYIVCVQSSNLKIISQPMEWTIDGEYGGLHEEVSIINCQKAIQIVTPK